MTAGTLTANDPAFVTGGGAAVRPARKARPDVFGREPDQAAATGQEEDTAKLPDRVNLKLTPRAARRLEELRVVTDAPTNAEVVRDAIRMYDYLVTEAQKGGEVCIRGKDGALTALKVLFF